MLSFAFFIPFLFFIAFKFLFVYTVIYVKIYIMFIKLFGCILAMIYEMKHFSHPPLSEQITFNPVTDAGTGMK